MFGINPTELIIVLLIIVLLFGAKRIPELARALGRASYEFKKAKKEIAEEGRELVAEAEKTAQKQDPALPAKDEEKHE